MRRFFITFFASLVLFVGVAAPAYAANLPLLDPNFTIVPSACTSCPCGYGGVLQLIQNLMNVAVSLGVIAFILVAAYAGFSFMVNPTNPEGRSKAKSMLLNVVVGMVIVLAAWLFVDFIMKTLYNSNSKYGPWNEILKDTSGGSQCIQEHGVVAIPGLGNGIIDAILGGGSNQVLTATGSGACNASTIQSAAAEAGVRMATSEANLLACLAGPESTCGTVMENYNWDAKKEPPPSTAYGPFQITLKGNSKCFENTACYAAAGVTGPLDCDDAFTSKGYSIPGTKLNQCRTAAANLACSAAAADCVYQEQHAKAWTADKSSAKQQSCINTYGG
jgi:hypothetical protein